MTGCHVHFNFLLAAVVTIGEKEVAKLSLATHDVEYVDAFIGVTIKDATGTDDNFSIPRAAKLRWAPA